MEDDNKNELNEENNLNEQVEQNEKVEANNVEEKSENKTETTKSNAGGIANWIKSNTKLVIIIVAVIAVVVIAALVVPNLVGSPEQAVKNYVSAISTQNANKYLKCIDVRGMTAYAECSGYFSKDLSKFKEEYDKIDKDSVDYDKDDAKKAIEYMVDDDYKNFSLKVVDIKQKEKVKDCKDLYKVVAKIRIKYKDEDGDSQDTTEEKTFYVYKNKIVYASMYF